MYHMVNHQFWTDVRNVLQEADRFDLADQLDDIETSTEFVIEAELEPGEWAWIDGPFEEEGLCSPGDSDRVVRVDRASVRSSTVVWP